MHTCNVKFSERIRKLGTHILNAFGRLAIAGLICGAAGGAVAQQGGQSVCGDPFHNHFGPFDYRTAPIETRKLVEDYHFTSGVEAMITPKTTTAREIAADVAYTLRVFPNHPRALLTMTRLAEKHKIDPPPGTSTTVECWFDRALRFRPDDTVSRVFFAQYLAKRGRTAEALKQLEAATTYAADNGFSQYNIGLVYFDMRQYDRALAQAHKASALGFQRTDLSEQLKRVNKWSEPVTQ